MKKKAKSKAELQLPELQAIILRTARHLPCLFHVSLSLSRPDASLRAFLVCDRASCIAHTTVAAKDVDQHHTTATFRHALFADERPTREHATSLCLRSLFFLGNAYTTGHDHVSGMVFQWVVSYFTVRIAVIPCPILPAESTARFRRIRQCQFGMQP